jgi:7-carboxy-7-deazaguanine synthase
MHYIKTLIPSNPDFDKNKPLNEPYLEIAEFFFDTIQGEGINLGHPAAFLRLQYCTLNCWWCDTKAVWRAGNPYSFGELFDLIEATSLVDKLKMGQHLVLTGGSPLRQQEGLTLLLQAFISRHGFKPFIEIENECTIMPNPDFVKLVDVWNNSPKLIHSGNALNMRYKPEILKFLAGLPNTWFKFVIVQESDWNEIETSFLQPGLIKREQIILMPLGSDRVELNHHRELVVKMAIRESIRYCSREHIVLWDRKTGV